MLVLVTEDDEEYAEIVAEILRRESHEVVIAGSVNGALRFVEQKLPDLAVLDVMLPDGSGHDVARELRKRSPELPILFLSSLDRVTDRIAGFDAGADDYVAKPFHPAEFVARVRALARRSAGEVPVRRPQGVTVFGLVFDESNGAAYLDGTNLGCTPLEFDIMRELAAVPGQVLSHSYLNDRVWGYGSMTDGTLLKGHISAIRRKMRDAGGTEEMVRTVHGVGYSLVPREPAESDADAEADAQEQSSQPAPTRRAAGS